MNTIINIQNIVTNIETGETSITLIEDKLPEFIIVEESIEISMIELGVQGPQGKVGVGLNVQWDGDSLGVKREDENNFNYVNLKGNKGDNLDYNKLTQSEKYDIIEQYDNVLGNTSYTNIFLNTLLS